MQKTSNSNQNEAKTNQNEAKTKQKRTETKQKRSKRTKKTKQTNQNEVNRNGAKTNNKLIVDGLNECVLLEDDSSMPEGEQIPCTPTIFRELIINRPLSI